MGKTPGLNQTSQQKLEMEMGLQSCLGIHWGQGGGKFQKPHV